MCGFSHLQRKAVVDPAVTFCDCSYLVDCPAATEGHEHILGHDLLKVANIEQHHLSKISLNAIHINMIQHAANSRCRISRAGKYLLFTHLILNLQFLCWILIFILIVNVLINVLLELISIREGAFSLSDFDDFVTKELIELICAD